MQSTDFAAARPTIADLQRAKAAALRRDDWRSAATYEAAIAERVDAARTMPPPRVPRPRALPTSGPGVDPARAKAEEALARRRERVSMIRKRVAAGAISIFLAVTALVTARLVSGHDPALASTGHKTAVPALVAPAVSAAPQPDPAAAAESEDPSTAAPSAESDGSGSDDSGGAAPAQQAPQQQAQAPAPAPAPSPVTTSQS